MDSPVMIVISLLDRSDERSPSSTGIGRYRQPQRSTFGVDTAFRPGLLVVSTESVGVQRFELVYHPIDGEL